MNPVETISTPLNRASEADQASAEENRDLFEEFSRLLGRISHRINESNPALPDYAVPALAPKVKEIQDTSSRVVARESSPQARQDDQESQFNSESEEIEVDKKEVEQGGDQQVVAPEQVETSQAAAGAVKTEAVVQEEAQTNEAPEEVASGTPQAQAPVLDMETSELPLENSNGASPQTVQQGQVATKQAQVATEHVDQRQAPTEAAAVVDQTEPALNEMLEKLLNTESAVQMKVSAESNTESAPLSPEVSKLDALNFLLTAGVLRQGAEALSIKGAQTAVTSAQSEARVSESKAVQGAVTTSQGREAGLFKGQDARVRSESSRASRAVPRSAFLQNMEKVESALRQAASAKDGSRITVRFDPPELGTVKVDVSLKNGHLQARISSDSAQVNALLRERASEVHASLRRMGFDFDQVSVTVAGEQPVSDWQNMLSGEQSFQQQRDGRPSHGVDFMGPKEEINSSVVLDHWVA